jgi:hypothetical protein
MITLLLTSAALAGGGPLNVMVLYNADVPEALGVAETYQAARSLPDGHICGVTGVDPAAQQLDSMVVDTLIRAPLDACISALPAPDEIDYIVVVRGLPYQVNIAAGVGSRTSLSAQLQVFHGSSLTTGMEVAGNPVYESWGFSMTDLVNPVYISDAYMPEDFVVSNPSERSYITASGITRMAEVPHSFRRQDVDAGASYDLSNNLFVVTRLDGFDYQDALDLIDRGVAADGTFPTATLLCMEGADSARAARDPECEYATRMLSAAGFNAEYLSPYDSALSGRTVGAYLTGAANLRGAIDGLEYVPGALTDNITSYGALPRNWFCDATGTSCPENEAQTAIARFVRAGATGAHGTVAEPYNFAFPNAGLLLLYTFGYNLGESYHFNQRYLYWMNTILGDPLTTPYATRPTLSWPAEVHEGEALTITAAHADGVSETRLYRDGALVASAVGGSLDVVLEAVDGEEVSLLVVAVAENVIQPRLGWPEENPLPQADVQGWLVGSVQVLEALPGDTGVEPDTGEPVDTGDTGTVVDTDDTADTDDPDDPDDTADTDDTGSPDGSGGSGLPGDDEDGSLCGCSTPAGRSPLGGLAGLLLVFVALARARRDEGPTRGR